jgi:histidine triad (HIT) family protein
MSNCLFCNIVEGKIPSTIVFQNENVIAFNDLHPQATIHVLFIHRLHTRDINDLTQNNPDQLADLFNAIRLYTEKENLTKNGFRIVTNQGPHAGQTVFHTHFHVLAGESLSHFGS